MCWDLLRETEGVTQIRHVGCKPADKMNRQRTVIYVLRFAEQKLSKALCKFFRKILADPLVWIFRFACMRSPE